MPIYDHLSPCYLEQAAVKCLETGMRQKSATQEAGVWRSWMLAWGSAPLFALCSVDGLDMSEYSLCRWAARAGATMMAER